MAEPDVALDAASAPVDGPGAVGRRGAAHLRRLAVAAHVVAVPQAQAWRWPARVVVIGFYLVVLGADFLAYSDPNASEAQRSLMPPQRIYWFDGGRFSPHVYAVKGAPRPADLQARLSRRPQPEDPHPVLRRGLRVPASSG